MSFYSHSEQLGNGAVKGSKKLKEHIRGVHQKASNQFYEGLQFGWQTDELKDLLETVVQFHDLGKYTSYFQHYLLDQPPIDYKLKQHARLGGYAAFNYLEGKNNKKALIALCLIFLHHSKLLSPDVLTGKIDKDAKYVFDHQLEDIEPTISTIEKELEIDPLESLLHFPDSKTIRRQSRIWVKKNQNIADYFLINYLFSLLIEADKLDASETPRYDLVNINSHWVDRRFGVPDSSDFKNLKNLTNNELRNYCRSEVISHLESDDILDHSLFTLTAPTGIGKTMTALDFSIKLKDKLRNDRDHEAQIIYALPFINIIEQALNEYEKTLCIDDIRILAHYQFADIFGPEDNPDENYHQKLMKLDTWQGDIIITSFVQFFETAVSNRNKMLKTFNHLAGSIIILDEVQTLRLDQMPLIGAVLFYLAQFLDARIIMMTATKPKIFELAEREILCREDESPNTVELLSSHEEVFSLFKRTSIHPLLESVAKEEQKTEQFVKRVFAEKWVQAKSCIIVCNTVNRSIEVYKEIKKYLDSSDLPNPVFYLSTNIIPSNRMDKIEKIKKAIQDGLSPILVSTQVVEAGVDLDFDMGFRDLGPIDSIIQVAGRINRNNDKNRQHAPLYVVDFGECVKIYGQLTYQQAKKALRGKDLIHESDYLGIIERYFDGISNRSSFRSSRAYFESLKSLNYDSPTPKEDFAISSFRIIEDSGLYLSVFIEIDEEAKFLQEKYLEKIKGDITVEQFDQNYKMKFQQHIISVPHYYADDLLPINEYEENILIVSNDELNEYYDEETGFIRQRETESIMMF